MNDRTRVAFVFPGQGSQYVGMGKEFHDHFPAVKGLFDAAADVLEMDVAKLCFEGPESVLIQTRNVQPAVTLVNLACLRVLTDHGVAPAATAGHSLGEYSALHAAGVLSLEDTLRIVHRRGELMQQAAEHNPGGMLAVMGLAIDRFDDVCEQARSAGSVEIANHNSPGQVILTGEPDALALAGKLAKKQGAVFSMPLKVSGPWHSRFMAPASEKLEAALADCSFAEPAVPVASNVTGEYFADAAEIRRGLVRQVVSPVRWVACVERMIEDGIRLFVELGPGNMLAGLIRDIDNKVRVVSVESREALDKLDSLLSAADGSGS